MFRESSHATTEAIIDLIRTLPEREQKTIVKKLSATPKPQKKLSKKAKKKQEILNGIAEGLREFKEAERTGRKMKTLDEFLNEI